MENDSIHQSVLLPDFFSMPYGSEIQVTRIEGNISADINECLNIGGGDMLVMVKTKLSQQPRSGRCLVRNSGKYPGIRGCFIFLCQTVCLE